MKIVFSGGGTLGPVVPLLAVAEIYRERHPETEFVWVGTKNGPEKKLVEQYKIRFLPIGAGKWRRYFSLLNLFDVFRVVVAFFKSVFVLMSEKPDLVVSAGGYVSVPLHFAAALLGIPSWVHQQDVRLGLANKLMFPIATKITTALEETAKILPVKKTEWIGNPTRDLRVNQSDTSRQIFGIPGGAKVVLAMGGGTGSMSVNQLVTSALPAFNPNWHIIHLVGRDRPSELAERMAGVFPNYHVYSFFTSEMKDAYAVADVVVARAGFSTLTELASLSKPAMILPMTGTHQEENAKAFADKGGIVLLDDSVSGLKLAQMIRELFEDKNKLASLGKRMHELLPAASEEKIVSIIDKTVKKVDVKF